MSSYTRGFLSAFIPMTITTFILMWVAVNRNTPPPIIYAPPPESDCYVHRTDAGWQERIPTDMCWASLVGHLFVDQERSSRVLTTIELGSVPRGTEETEP